MRWTNKRTKRGWLIGDIHYFIIFLLFFCTHTKLTHAHNFLVWPFFSCAFSFTLFWYIHFCSWCFFFLSFSLLSLTLFLALAFCLTTLAVARTRWLARSFSLSFFRFQYKCVCEFIFFLLGFNLFCNAWYIDNAFHTHSINITDRANCVQSESEYERIWVWEWPCQMSYIYLYIYMQKELKWWLTDWRAGWLAGEMIDEQELILIHTHSDTLIEISMYLCIFAHSPRIHFLFSYDLSAPL